MIPNPNRSVLSSILLVFLLAACAEEPQPAPPPARPGACEFYDVGPTFGCLNVTSGECDHYGDYKREVHFHHDLSCADIGYTIPSVADIYLAEEGGQVASPNGYFRNHPDQDLAEEEPDEAPACESENTGTLTIFSKANVASIYVYLDDQYLGMLTQYYSDDGPDCGEEIDGGTVTVTVEAGPHALHATANLGEWRSTVEVETCGCSRYWLNP